MSKVFDFGWESVWSSNHHINIDNSSSIEKPNNDENANTERDQHDILEDMTTKIFRSSKSVLPMR